MLLWTIAQLTAGLAMLFWGGDWLVKGAVGMAHRLGVSTLVIGLTVVAFGTSAPELVLSMEAALDGYPAIAFGNVVGSNIANILLIIGAAACIWPVAIGEISHRENIYVLVLTAVVVACAWGGVVPRWVGVGLLVSLLGMTVWLYRAARRDFKAGQLTSGDADQAPEEERMSTGKAIFWAGLGLVVLVAGSRVLVPAAVELARYFGWSEALIGVTLVAVGTSTPELATSLVAAWKRQSDIAIGNVLGSNIFNIAGVLGAVSIVKPIPVAERFLHGDMPVLVGVSLLLTLIILRCRTVGRGIGLLMLAGFVGYNLLQFFYLR